MRWLPKKEPVDSIMEKQSVVERIEKGTNFTKLMTEYDSLELKTVFVNRFKFFISIVLLVLIFTVLLALPYYIGASLPQEVPEKNTPIQIFGTGGFGAVIGWLVYYINRYRVESVTFSDFVSIFGIIFGGLIIRMFSAGADLFISYAIGLFIGFFGNFYSLLAIKYLSKSFSVNWFLDSRRIGEIKSKKY